MVSVANFSQVTIACADWGAVATVIPPASTLTIITARTRRLIATPR
jgi:hypothetical protein